jgi:hypothetical protein
VGVACTYLISLGRRRAESERWIFCGSASQPEREREKSALTHSLKSLVRGAPSRRHTTARTCAADRSRHISQQVICRGHVLPQSFWPVPVLASEQDTMWLGARGGPEKSQRRRHLPSAAPSVSWQIRVLCVLCAVTLLQTVGNLR